MCCEKLQLKPPHCASGHICAFSSRSTHGENPGLSFSLSGLTQAACPRDYLTLLQVGACSPLLRTAEGEAGPQTCYSPGCSPCGGSRSPGSVWGDSASSQLSLGKARRAAWGTQPVLNHDLHCHDQPRQICTTTSEHHMSAFTHSTRSCCTQQVPTPRGSSPPKIIYLHIFIYYVDIP